MFRKFKSVVVFFKILVTLVLSRPFGKVLCLVLKGTIEKNIRGCQPTNVELNGFSQRPDDVILFSHLFRTFYILLN